jgi:hypothetical protein
MTAQRTKVADELKARQYRVLSAPPDDAAGTVDIVRRAVQESSLSIHFVAQQPGADPSAAVTSAERDIASCAGLVAAA